MVEPMASRRVSRRQTRAEGRNRHMQLSKCVNAAFLPNRVSFRLELFNPTQGSSCLYLSLHDDTRTYASTTSPK
jgi:hypothetical protein